MRAHDRRVEHLDHVGGRTHRGKRVKEGFEDPSLAQSVEAFPHAVPRTKAFRQGAPSNVLDGEEMERLEEAPVILGLPSPSREAGAKHRKRMRPILLIHLCRHAPRPLIRSESYESCHDSAQGSQTSSLQNSSTRPSLSRLRNAGGLAATQHAVARVKRPLIDGDRLKPVGCLHLAIETIDRKRVVVAHLANWRRRKYLARS